jgi:hypothetical protein
MSRKQHRPPATSQLTLEPTRTQCWVCGGTLWTTYHNYRTVITLHGLCSLTLKIRRCRNPQCPLYHKPYRPEEEGALALPKGEFGLDVIALIGALRYGQHRSVPEIHREMGHLGVSIAQRTVTYLIQRYEELVAIHLADSDRLKARLSKQGKVVLGIDGLQPDMGHEVLWVIRDCLSGEILLARPLLSSSHSDLFELLREVRGVLEELSIPIGGVISDGERSIRLAVGAALPTVPHQLCQFHYLRDAAHLMYEADRHAKKELKKAVRGVRPIERSLEAKEAKLKGQTEQGPGPGLQGTDAAIVGYCLAVRSALTEDGPPPLCAPGLKLHDRLQAIRTSLERVEIKRGSSGCLDHRCRPN